jgi:hypothetical protein
LFRDYGKTMPPVGEEELSVTFRAIKRDKAQVAQQEGGIVKTGKDPLEFSLYKFMAKELLQIPQKEYTFAHCVFVISWNLMCRVSNGSTICFSHMEWREDALGIYFCHMKNDQLGERPKDPRHVYANPLLPEICPILALGIYLMTHPVGEGVQKLFPGTNQAERFRKIIVNLMNNHETVSKALGDRGMNPDDIGTHSIRKGSSTYCTSGTTASPSNAAVHLRAGWALGGVQDTYLRYEAAGDQHVGRTVSGLPSTEPQFAILPPFFKERPPELSDIIVEAFPNIPANMARVAEFCLASVVYHRQFLRETLPAKHPLFFTSLFRTNKLALLAPFIQCRLGQIDDPIQATGIPPHVTVLLRMNDIERKLDQVVPAMTNLQSSIVDGITNVLEERAIGAGTVTRDGLQEMLHDLLVQTGVTTLKEDLLRQCNGMGQSSAPAVEETQTQVIIGNEQALPVFHYGGRFYLVPQDFHLPKGNGLIAWQYWCCGDPSKQWPPFRRLKQADMPPGNARKRFSDFKFLMEKVQAKVVAEGRWVLNPTIQQVNEMFNIGVKALQDPTAAQKRGQRPYQAEWPTLVNQMRKRQKTQEAQVINE